MKDGFSRLAGRIESMQLRERALLLLAGTALLFLLFDMLGLQPVFRQQEQGKQAISDWTLKLDALRERSRPLSDDPSGVSLQQRNQLQERLADLESRLQKQLGALLEPEQAIEVLRQVLAQEQDLTLHKVNAVSEPLSDPKQDDADKPATAGIGRYELRLELQGSYLGTLRYLRALEALPWKFFWEEVNFEVMEHPEARVTLDIYTLGLLGG